MRWLKQIIPLLLSQHVSLALIIPRPCKHQSTSDLLLKFWLTGGLQLMVTHLKLGGANIELISHSLYLKIKFQFRITVQEKRFKFYMLRYEFQIFLRSGIRISTKRITRYTIFGRLLHGPNRYTLCSLKAKIFEYLSISSLIYIFSRKSPLGCRRLKCKFISLL